MRALTDILKGRGKPPIPTPVLIHGAPDSAEVVLQRALELFGPDGERWVQHKRQDKGRFCAIAAIQEAANGDSFLQRRAEERLRATVGRSPMLWNDSPGRHFSQIQAGFAAAIAGERTRWDLLVSA